MNHTLMPLQYEKFVNDTTKVTLKSLSGKITC